MLLRDWTVATEGDNCVHVHINEDVDINNLELSLLSETRTPIVKMKVNSHEIYLCSQIEKPMFVQIGHSVKYVNGSGKSFYNN